MDSDPSDREESPVVPGSSGESPTVSGADSELEAEEAAEAASGWMTPALESARGRLRNVVPRQQALGTTKWRRGQTLC